MLNYSIVLNSLDASFVNIVYRAGEPMSFTLDGVSHELNDDPLTNEHLLEILDGSFDHYASVYLLEDCEDPLAIVETAATWELVVLRAEAYFLVTVHKTREQIDFWPNPFDWTISMLSNVDHYTDPFNVI